jgi:hypothetical protein
VVEDRLDLELVEAGAGRPHRGEVTGGGDLDRPAQAGERGGVLN